LEFGTVLFLTALEIGYTPDPTWRKGDQSNINDYILTKNASVLQYQVHNDDDSYSDHLLIMFNIDLEKTTSKPIFHTDPVKLSANIQNLQIATPALHTEKEVNGFLGNLIASLQGCIDEASERIRIN